MMNVREIKRKAGEEREKRTKDETLSITNTKGVKTETIVTTITIKGK
jgi:hypothetical protein